LVAKRKWRFDHEFPFVMRQGVFLPPFDGVADPNRLVELAQVAESVGWDGFFLWDHLLYDGGVTKILDPYISLAAIASATTTIQLGPMVTPLIRRRPQIVARQAVTLDLLARGRLILGFGIGDDGEFGELSRFGEVTDAVERGKNLSESLEVLTGLLSGESVHHVGERYTIDDVTFQPTAARSGGIPIWLAARWPNIAPLRRAARFDGVFVISMKDPDDVPQLRAQLASFGADLEHFDVVVSGFVGDDPTPWAEAGVTWFLNWIGPYNLDFDEVREMIASGPRLVES
jgi:alkanesulfonate monooxygenase SsuD/methylene tetrahydromethanopterin reductase-like flavin-dependent oxidoreductase (luciferase family)